MNKDSYLILETLPAEYDSRVKAMEVDERPTEQYSDIGGLDKQIQELIEAVVLPVTHKERFENLGECVCICVFLYLPRCDNTGKELCSYCPTSVSTLMQLGRIHLSSSFGPPHVLVRQIEKQIGKLEQKEREKYQT